MFPSMEIHCIYQGSENRAWDISVRGYHSTYSETVLTKVTSGASGFGVPHVCFYGCSCLGPPMYFFPQNEQARDIVSLQEYENNISNALDFRHAFAARPVLHCFS